MSDGNVTPSKASSAEVVRYCAVSHLTHDDRALYRQVQVGKRLPNQGDDTLHAVNFLAQENVHRGQCAHLLQSCLYLQTAATSISTGWQRSDTHAAASRGSPGSFGSLNCKIQASIRPS